MVSKILPQCHREPSSTSGWKPAAHRRLPGVAGDTSYLDTLRVSLRTGRPEVVPVLRKGDRAPVDHFVRLCLFRNDLSLGIIEGCSFILILFIIVFIIGPSFILFQLL